MLTDEIVRLYDQGLGVWGIAEALALEVGTIHAVLRVQERMGPAAAAAFRAQGWDCQRIGAHWALAPRRVQALLAVATRTARPEQAYGVCDECGAQCRGRMGVVVVGEDDAGQDVAEAWCPACVERLGVRVEYWEEQPPAWEAGQPSKPKERHDDDLDGP
jgi:hypothetical protein